MAVQLNRKFQYLPGPVVDLRLISISEGDDTELPYYWFDIIEKDGFNAVGSISIRIGHNDHSYLDGNIGYEVEEPYRGHHYSYYASKMVMEIAKYHGMNTLYVTCDLDNAASYKTIERLGGILVETLVPPVDCVFCSPDMGMKRIYRLSLA